MATAPFIEVEDLSKHFDVTKTFTRKKIGMIRAVNRVSFNIGRGQTLGLVGESGCGKTTTGRCVIRAIQPTSGRIVYNPTDGESVDLAALDKPALKRVRRTMRMIFQDPFSSLNPRMSVQQIVSEPLIVNRLAQSRSEIEERVASMLRLVGLDPAYMRRFPHAFSGGQRQRIAIARALVTDPKFIIADEPLSALDVSIQAQILNLLKKLKAELDLTYLFISHNLSVVEHVSDHVAVMYVGKLVELATNEALFRHPLHPYTEALLSAVPVPDPDYKKSRIILKGEIASLLNPLPGCQFHPRCSYAQEICGREEPAFVNRAKAGEEPHHVACHFADRLSLRGVGG